MMENLFRLMNAVRNSGSRVADELTVCHWSFFNDASYLNVVMIDPFVSSVPSEAFFKSRIANQNKRG